jgi:hypothetical protein
MANFKRRFPRLTTQVLCECFAKDVLFKPWDKMPKSAQEEFEKNGPIPCEGGGVPGQWCERCRFGKVREPETVF